ncbi:hypothetical protein C0966_12685 [Bacillus methanolicus]|uniref:zinc ribbon domain-containing protein n=1 Tax=Bacillus methanolicus TaxID=1471 RepID=UPI0023806D66|nr:zinc ribbon domain-containing protein [Bacillus methanolicus]MDE3840203.1 hypothetical protein [Bacillus methanolicus]
MYCSTCGAENSASNNYCINDGTKLKPYQGKYSLDKSASQFCSNCGNAAAPSDNYCGSCGTTLYSYKKTGSKDAISPVKANVQITRAIPKFNMEFFKPALFSSAAALLLVFIMSFVVFSTNKNTSLSFLEKELNIDVNEVIKDAEIMTDSIPEPDSLFGLTDMVMASHFISPVFKVDMNIDEPISGEIKLSFGAMILLLIPLLSLFSSGMIYQKISRETSPASLFYGAITVGIIYGLLLVIISLFSGFDYDVDSELLSIKIHTSYSIFSAFIKGFGFAFLFSYIGMLFAINFKKATGHLSQVHEYGEAIHQGISTFFRSMLAFSVISIIIFKMMTDKFLNQLAWLIGDATVQQIIDKSSQFVLAIGTQIGLFTWNLSSFGTLKLVGRSDDEDSIFTYSMFKGIETKGDFTDLDLYKFHEIIDSSNFGLYTKLGTLLLIILFIWSGYRISKKASNSLVSIVIYSFVYSLLFSLLTAITKFHISGTASNESSFEMMLGFSGIAGFIKSYLMSFIFAYAGTFIAKWKS